MQAAIKLPNATVAVARDQQATKPSSPKKKKLKTKGFIKGKLYNG